MVGTVVSGHDDTRLLGSKMNDEEMDSKVFDIPEDAYGCAVLAIVRDFQEAARGQGVAIHLTSGIFSICLYIANLALQLGIIAFIHVYVVEPKIDSVQRLYKEFHGNAFDEKHDFREDKWRVWGLDSDDGHATDLCQIAVTNRLFYITILLLWCTAILKEFRNSDRLFRDISAVPHCRLNADMILEESDGKTEHIVALTPPIRITLYVLVCIPKLLICMLLLFLGCQWLSATDTFEDLIMNSVAMEFVTHIDELLYEVMIPNAYKKELESIDFTVPCAHTSAKHQREAELWKGFKRTFIYIGAIFAWLFIYTEYIQTVFPQSPSDVAEHCQYLWDQSKRACGFSGKLVGALLHGSNEEDCFPYGVQYDGA